MSGHSSRRSGTCVNGIYVKHEVCGLKPQQTVEQLTVLGSHFALPTSGANPNNNHRWWCVVRCDCGTVKVVQSQKIRPGRTISCGCQRTANRIRHGMAGSRLYWTWHGMIQRCETKTSFNYDDYGGRGITVVDEWKDFTTFAEWALSNNYQDNLQIDRKDNNGNYEPSNCRFVTSKVNCRNTRFNVNLTAFGETKCISAWVEDDRCSVSHGCLNWRIKNDWDTVRAIVTPSCRRTPKT